ncbi:tail fiber domain-containing protein [Stenotrophomonas geniculata]|uniref:tail fiber domain-containing protein n=1 Tax=Stenotrophomonas geniculata TaxID=86188 RepID=UPI0013132708
MVDVKISGLPAAGTLNGNEAIPAVQGGSNVKVLVSAIRAGMLAAGQMGLAAESIQVANNISTLNNATLSGFYRAAAGSEGNPTPTGAFLCIHLPSGGTATYGAQLGISEADGRIYQRLKTNGAWGSWIPNAFDTQVVHSTGAENIGGAKTFTARSIHNLGARIGVDQVLEMGGAGATFRGNGTGSLVIGSAGPSTGGLILLRPQGDQVATNQVTIYTNGAMDFSGDAASKAQTRTSLGAVGNAGDENIAGIKTFTSNNAIRSLAAGAGFWLESLSATYGFMVNTDGTRLNVNLRSPNFGAQVSTLFQFTDAGARTGTPLTPFTANTQTVGTAAVPFNQFFAQNTAISASDARLKTPLETLTDTEEAAFLEIGALPAKWKWKARVEEEGDAARWHAGPSVQAAIAVMERHGLNAFAYSAFCYDSWPAEDEVWREWPAQEAEVVEWPAVPETWADIPAEVDEAGEIVVPARRELVHEAMPAGRVVLKEAVEAGRELIQSAVEAGDRYSFRVSELQAWILAATARRDRREREAAELRLASIEQRLAVLESGK